MRDGSWMLLVGALAAGAAACGAPQRAEREVTEATPPGTDVAVMTGSWCDAAATPDWLPGLLSTGVYPPLAPTPTQDAPKELGDIGLPEVEGDFVSVGLVDLELDGVGELIATWSTPYDDEGVFSSVGVWRCTPEGWSQLELASSEYVDQDGLLRLGVPQRVPGAGTMATVLIRADWDLTGEAWASVAVVMVEDGYVAVMSRGDVSERVDAYPAPGHYGGEPLSVSGWLPLLDAEGWLWTSVLIDYGWEILEERWEAPDAGDRPEDWVFYQHLLVRPVVGSTHGEDPWDASEGYDPVYVVLGGGEPPSRCTGSRGCHVLSDADREQLAGDGFTWVLGAWSSLDTAMAAIDALDREDTILLGNDEEIWERLEYADNDAYPYELPPPEILHPRLRTMIELPPTWR